MNVQIIWKSNRGLDILTYRNICRVEVVIYWFIAQIFSLKQVLHSMHIESIDSLNEPLF